MNKHRQAMSSTIECHKKRHEFSQTNMTDRLQTLPIKDSPSYRAIELKVKNLCYLDEKIKKNEEKITSVQKEVDELNNDITIVSNKVEQQIIVIEKECSETKDMEEELSRQDNPKLLLESMRKIDCLSKKIGKWFEEVGSLKIALEKWLKKSELLAETNKEWTDDMKAWDYAFCNTEKHLSILTLRLEVEEGIREYQKQFSVWVKGPQSDLHSNSEKQRTCWPFWLKEMKNKIKTQHIRFLRFENKLEKMKSLSWKSMRCEDSYIASCFQCIEKDSKGIKELGTRIKKEWKEILKIGKLQITGMDQNLKSWCTKTRNIYKEIQSMEGDVKLFTDEAMFMDYKVKLTDLSAHIKVCNRQFKYLQKETSEWLARGGRLEKNLTKTDEDFQKGEKQAYQIEHCIRIMNRMLEADNKMAALRAAVSDFTSNQTRQWNIGMEPDINSSRIKNSKEEFGKIKYDFWDYNNIWNCGRLIKIELSKIDSLTLNIYRKRNSLLHQFAQQNKESGSVRTEIEKSSTIIEQRYEEIKQKPEHWIGATNLVDNIAIFCKEVDRCDKDLRERLPVWEKRNNDLKGEMLSYESDVTKQEEMISSVELGIRLLKCQLAVKKEMDEYKELLEEMSSECKERSDWREHERKMKKERATIHGIHEVISNSREELLNIPNNNSKYGTVLCEDFEKKVKQTISTVEQMDRTSKELYENTKSIRHEIAYMDTIIKKKFKELKETRQYLPIAYDQSYQARLHGCESLVITIRKSHEKVRLRAETVKKWYSSMAETNIQVQALQMNPCNIRLDGFRKILNDCMVKFREQERERNDCETMWRNHQIRKKKATQNVDEMMVWLEKMPESAELSFQQFQSRMGTGIKSSEEQLSEKGTDITNLHLELRRLSLKVSHLKKEMEPVKLMINTPGVFEVELPGHLGNKNYPEKIANVFKKLDGWNKTYEVLEQILCKYHEKKEHFKKSISEWNEIKMKSFRDLPNF